MGRKPGTLPPAAGMGRKAGSKNKFPTALKEKVLHACAHLEAQGKDLASCAEKDPPWFYENFVKPMLPKDVVVSGDKDNPLLVTITKVTSGK